MIQADRGDGRPLPCLSQNEGALDNRLDILSEARSTPSSVAAVGVHCRRDVGFEHGGVFAQALLAGYADGRMCLVSLLHHGAQKAGEFGQLPLQQRLAKLHVAQEPIQRVGELPIGCV